MNEIDLLHAEIGRLGMQNKRLAAKLAATCRAFAEVIAGTCDPKRVLINLTTLDVIWAAEGQSPALPAMIDLGDGRGPQPECVAGSDPPALTAALAAADLLNQEIDRLKAEAVEAAKPRPTDYYPPPVSEPDVAPEGRPGDRP